MGANISEKKNFYSVSFGKFVHKVNAGTEGSVMRKNKEGKDVYELIYDSLSGKLESVKRKVHEEYGAFWDVSLRDVGELFVATFNEDSQYGREFLKRLPLLRGGDLIELRPYEYEKNGKNRSGLKIQRDGEDINSYFQDFKKNDDDSWTITNLHGYPAYDGKRGDKDEWKIYTIKVAKFLREFSLAYVDSTFKTMRDEPEVRADDSDLPF